MRGHLVKEHPGFSLAAPSLVRRLAPQWALFFPGARSLPRKRVQDPGMRSVFNEAPPDPCLTGVRIGLNMTPMAMTKTQVYLDREELKALHAVARRTGTSVAALVREAIRRVWVRPGGRGPVGLWNGKLRRSSVEHDAIYDDP